MRAITTGHTADIFRMLGDQTRLAILALLFASEHDLCVQDIADAVDISHSATSHQLSKLEAWGIVRSFRMGQTVCYEIQDTEFTKRINTALRLFE
jgi:ArsR family transcriptional regulator, lead/cadmium/zinc/bismuth-responsive transcriptional repressor